MLTNTDTDLVAYRDGVLYLFECKNAYHPCNPHEMRNSYDHIRKAGTQLTFRQQKSAKPNTRRRFGRPWGGTCHRRRRSAPQCSSQIVSLLASS